MRRSGPSSPPCKRTLLAVDVSGSMGVSVSGMPITAREASAALALVQLATEPSASAVGFTTRPGSQGWHDSALRPLAISPRRRLDDALRAAIGTAAGADAEVVADADAPG